MANSLIACVFFAVLAVVAADFCSYELYPDETRRTAYCSYGCCYTMIYPCCQEPFYVSAGFIAPMVIGSVGLFIVFVVIIVVIVVRRKRMRAIPTVQYTTPMVGQQVVTTNGGVVTYPGYGNTQYIAQPMYQSQPANGTTPMYTLQPGAGGTAPMYMMPGPNGAPPAYQQLQGSAPPYGVQPAAGTDPEPSKTPLQ
ncbi:hypothetical protein BsWGS_22605 [Bradybaena similaris]